MADYSPQTKKFDYSGGSYNDIENVYAEGMKLIIDFYHIPSHNSIAFKAFITDYSETYEVKYDKQESFGRQDPFSQYINTQRNISLGWDVVAASEKEAKDNMLRCQELIQLLYPSYKEIGGQKSIDESPTFLVNFSNWVRDSNTSTFGSAKEGGLHCLIENLQFNPDLEQGSFDTSTGVYPKVIKLSCAISPFTPPGAQWEEKQKGENFERFPFGHLSKEQEEQSRDAALDNRQSDPTEAEDAEIEGLMMSSDLIV